MNGISNEKVGIQKKDECSLRQFTGIIRRNGKGFHSDMQN